MPPSATLTQRMLAFARKQEHKLETVDVSALVRGMAEIVERTIGGGIIVETRFPLSLKPVRTDHSQLELALLNLAVNARDAMPDGGRIIIAAREAQAAAQNAQGLVPGRYVCLSVRDEGTGMDADTLARAMEPFFTTKGVGKGTGLGLSMVHGLAEQCGGKLVLMSRPGEGTTAELWLPVAAASAGQADSGRKAGRPVSIEPRVILAVDDDRLVLTNTAAMLADLGHRVLEAASGKEALEILSEHPADLVITDYMMPQMTGLQLAEAMRAGWPDLPVLIASGYAELPADASISLPKLAKPFREEQLSKAIAEALAFRPDGRVVRFPGR